MSEYSVMLAMRDWVDHECECEPDQPKCYTCGLFDAVDDLVDKQRRMIEWLARRISEDMGYDYGISSESTDMMGKPIERIIEMAEKAVSEGE